jgi:hypothetical protein
LSAAKVMGLSTKKNPIMLKLMGDFKKNFFIEKLINLSYMIFFGALFIYCN